MRTIRIALAAAALTLSGAAQAALQLPYSNVLVFGDSLVDAGNAQIASIAANLGDPAPAAAGYFQGRFSNGPTFADYVNQTITGTDANTTASFLGGDNYGFGGALTAFSPTETRRSFLTQIADFGAQPIAADTLVIVTFGGNDIRATVTDPGKPSFDAAVADLRSGLETLVGFGARTIVVTGLPDIGTLPGVVLGGVPAEQRATLTQRSSFLNREFAVTARDVSAETDASVRFFNLFDFQRGVLADPTSVGLPANLNTTIPCQLAGPAAVAAGCNGFLYFDFIHPTTQIHQAIAGGLLQVASVPEPTTWVMLIAGFGLLGGLLRRRTRRTLAAA